MLHVLIGVIDGDTPEKYTYNSDAVFDSLLETSWINDPDIIKLIKEIDNNDVIIREAYDQTKGEQYRNYEIISPVFGHITPQEISSSVKTAIVAIKCPEYLCSTVRMGDNAIEALERISDRHEITIYAETSYWFNCRVHILNDDSYTNNKQEYIDKYLDIAYD